MKEVLIEKNFIKVLFTSDVLVIGGGPAGLTAAVAAARMGAKTAIIERYGYFGGMSTGGLVILLEGNTDGKKNEIKGGIYKEVVDRLEKLGATLTFKNSNIIVNPEYLKFVYQQMVQEEKIIVLTNTLAVGARLEEGAVSHIIIENKSGRGAISTRFVVDCTGDGDTAQWCNVPYELLPNSKLKPLTLVFRCGNIDITKAEIFKNNNQSYFNTLKIYFKEEFKMNLYWLPYVNKNEVWFNVINLEGYSCIDVNDLRDAEFLCREKIIESISWLRKKIPGFENAVLIDTAPQIGARESRRIRGKYWLNNLDCKKGEIFKDSVVLNTCDYLSGPVYGIPYRCLIPEEGPGNLLYAGRCISVDHAIFDSVRNISSCACLGQAAGTAAALALKNNIDVGLIDGKYLVDKLKKGKAILEYNL